MLVLFVMLLSSNAFADGEKVVQGMGNRAVRGVVNLVTGIIEWPVQIYKGYNNGFGSVENKVASKTIGTVLGFFRGIGHAGGRMSSGAIELFVFWAVSPEDNIGVGVPLDAEYAWEYGTQYSMFKPSFGEGVKPIGRKLLRGLGNGFLGIAELPGQTIKGKNEGNIAKGVGKGVWYWFSRTVYGFGDIFTCIVPNPEDNKGVSFEEKNAWDALSVGSEEL